MKKKNLIIAAAVLVVAIGSGASHAAQVTKILISGATGTVTGNAIQLGAAYKDFTVDVVTLATGTVVVRTDCNGSNDGVFDTTGMGDLITCGALKCTAVYNSQPMVQCRGVITSATGTNSTTVTILGVQ